MACDDCVSDWCDDVVIVVCDGYEDSVNGIGDCCDNGVTVACDDCVSDWCDDVVIVVCDGYDDSVNGMGN